MPMHYEQALRRGLSFRKPCGEVKGLINRWAKALCSIWRNLRMAPSSEGKIGNTLLIWFLLTRSAGCHCLATNEGEVFSRRGGRDDSDN